MSPADMEVKVESLQVPNSFHYIIFTSLYRRESCSSQTTGKGFFQFFGIEVYMGQAGCHGWYKKKCMIVTWRCGISIQKCSRSQKSGERHQSIRIEYIYFMKWCMIFTFILGMECRAYTQISFPGGQDSLILHPESFYKTTIETIHKEFAFFVCVSWEIVMSPKYAKASCLLVGGQMTSMVFWMVKGALQKVTSTQGNRCRPWDEMNAVLSQSAFSMFTSQQLQVGSKV